MNQRDIERAEYLGGAAFIVVAAIVMGAVFTTGAAIARLLGWLA